MGDEVEAGTERLRDHLRGTHQLNAKPDPPFIGHSRLVKLCQVSTRKTTARKHRVAAVLRAQQQAQLHEQRRLEAFLLPEDEEWLHMWT